MPGSLLAGGLRGRGRGRRRWVRPALDFEEALVERERSRDDLLLAREAHDVGVAARREILEPPGLDFRECDPGKRAELVTQATRVRHGLLGDRTARHENVEEDLADVALHFAARCDDGEHRRARLGRVLAVLVADMEGHHRERGRLLDGLAPGAHREDADRVCALREALERVRLRRVAPWKRRGAVVDEDLETLPGLRGGVLESLEVRELHLESDGSSLGGRLSGRGFRNRYDLV